MRVTQQHAGASRPSPARCAWLCGCTAWRRRRWTPSWPPRGLLGGSHRVRRKADCLLLPSVCRDVFWKGMDSTTVDSLPPTGRLRLAGPAAVRWGSETTRDTRLRLRSAHLETNFSLSDFLLL